MLISTVLTQNDFTITQMFSVIFSDIVLLYVDNYVLEVGSDMLLVSYYFYASNVSQ